MKKIFIICFILVANINIAFANVEIVDGDSINMDKRRIRLVGIDAPEYFQICKDKNNEPYDCGQSARNYLIKATKNKKITCECEEKPDKYKRDLCECFANGKSLNRKMVASGWAVSYSSKEFKAIEENAKKHQRGIWQGKFMRPALHRILQRYKEKK